MSKIDVDYSLRPNKSLVRSKIFQLTEEFFNPKHVHTENISFITFSGFRFIDSLEFYKRFNIRNIYSIENNNRRYIRAKFNKPFEFIDITHGEISNFIGTKYKEVIKTKKVIFLDYESRLKDNILGDIEDLFASNFFDKESLIFITFNITYYNKFTKTDFFLKLKNKLPKKILDIIPETVKSENYFKEWILENFSYYILNQIQRKYGSEKFLKEILKVTYNDTARMAIFGYLIRDRKEGETLFKEIATEEFSLPVLTYLEEHYILNNLSGNPVEIADRIGLEENDVKNFIKYA